MYSEKFIKSNT